jgi:arginyl-tRNA synthetase
MHLNRLINTAFTTIFASQNTTMVEQILFDKVNQLFEGQLNESQIQFQKTRKEFEGDVTLVVFPLLRVTKKTPEDSGQFIGEYLLNNVEEVTGFNVVKGFLNLVIANSYWNSQLNTIISTNDYGFAQNKTGKNYMVEYASPNTNKPLHLGHLRNIFLGYSVSNILKANGHDVIKTQIINDRGIHICKSMIAWQKFGNGETPQTSGLKGDKLVGKYYVAFDKEYKVEIAKLIEGGMEEEQAKKEASIFKEAQEMLVKWEDGDKEVVELWKMMNSWCYDGFDVTYQTMRVDFDKLYYESDTYILGKKIVEEGLEKGLLYKKEDNSVWCDLSSEKMDDKLLLRGDGTSVYMTQDIGTAVERFKDYPNTVGMVYTVGNEQEHHFKVLFAILKKLGYPFANECYHLSYGMVELPTGKMKSREGTVVDADDIMSDVTNEAQNMTEERGHIEGFTEEEKQDLYKTIGIGGLKYYLLRVDPKKGMMFNPEESIDLNGQTAPFIQYGHARIQAILRKMKPKNSVEVNTDIEIAEKDLIKLLVDYPAVIKEAGINYSPALVCNYTYELIKTFNSFYQSVSILREEDEGKLNLRLALAKEVAKVIKSSMDLLGINVPDRM